MRSVGSMIAPKQLLACQAFFPILLFPFILV